MKTARKIISTFFIIIAIVGVMVAVGQVDDTENEVAIRGIGTAAFAIGSIIASLVGGKEESCQQQ